MADLKPDSTLDFAHAQKILCVFRHGNTFDPGEVIRRVGVTDLPLSPSGNAQVSQLARDWSKHCQTHPQLWADQVYCSDRIRTQQTAQALLQEWAAPKPLPRFVPHPLFNEINYGIDENKPEAEVVARIGQTALNAWEQHNTPPPGWAVDPSVIQLQIIEFIEQLPQGTTWIVTSNGVARFMGPALGLTRAGGWKLKTAQFGIFLESPRGWRCAGWAY